MCPWASFSRRQKAQLTGELSNRMRLTRRRMKTLTPRTNRAQPTQHSQGIPPACANMSIAFSCRARASMQLLIPRMLFDTLLLFCCWRTSSRYVLISFGFVDWSTMFASAESNFLRQSFQCNFPSLFILKLLYPRLAGKACLLSRASHGSDFHSVCHSGGLRAAVGNWGWAMCFLKVQ